MNKIFTVLSLSLFILLYVSSISAQSIFTENFESGTPDPNWGVFYSGEDELTAVTMASAPEPLLTGGNYVGYIQDSDYTYSGSAVAINGDVSLSDYSIEGDVYCYVNHPDGSAYTGLVVYANTETLDFYKMRADFDVNDRINFSGLKTDANFQPLFNHNFLGSQNPGLFPTSNGWHKMKIEVKTLNADSTAFWCYFDGQLLSGCPIYDTTSTRNLSGSFGLYTFQMDFLDGIAGYFDNLVVNSLVTSVDDQSHMASDFFLNQNYPNPFNPETNISYQLSQAAMVNLTIYDLLGRAVKNWDLGEQPAGTYNIVWDGKDQSGNAVPSGVYLYSLKNGNFIASKKMILMK